MWNKNTKNLLALTFPIFFGMISGFVMQLADTWIVAKLGKAELAGVGVAGSVYFVFWAFLSGFISSTQSQIARQASNLENNKIWAEIISAVFCCLCVSVILFTVLQIAMPALFGLFHLDFATEASARDYFKTMSWIFLWNGIGNPCLGYLYGIKKNKQVFHIVFASQILNIILSWMLAFGIGFFPKLGVSGTALGTSLTTAISTLCFAVIVLQDLCSTRSNFKKDILKNFSLQDLSKNLLLALKTSSAQFILALSWTGLYWLMGKAGNDALGVLHVLAKSSLFVTYFGISIGIACTTLVSIDLGQKQNPENWAYTGAWSFAILMLPVAFVFLFFRQTLSDFFSLSANARLLLNLTLAGMQIVYLTAEGLVNIYSRAFIGLQRSGLVLCLNIIFQALIFFMPLFFLSHSLALSFFIVYIVWTGSKTMHAFFLLALWKNQSVSFNNKGVFREYHFN
jgi:MATE family multidrug resistance protein